LAPVADSASQPPVHYAACNDVGRPSVDRLRANLLPIFNEHRAPVIKSAPNPFSVPEKAPERQAHGVPSKFLPTDYVPPPDAFALLPDFAPFDVDLESPPQAHLPPAMFLNETPFPSDDVPYHWSDCATAPVPRPQARGVARAPAPATRAASALPSPPTPYPDPYARHRSASSSRETYPSTHPSDDESVASDNRQRPGIFESISGLRMRTHDPSLRKQVERERERLEKVVEKQRKEERRQEKERERLERKAARKREPLRGLLGLLS